MASTAMAALLGLMVSASEANCAPAQNRTQQAAPSQNRTQQAVPSQNRTQQAAPSQNRTQQAAPSQNRTQQAAPSQNRTQQSGAGQNPVPKEVDLRPIQRSEQPPSRTNEVKLPPEPAPHAPSRFEGGAAAAPTPTGGAQGGAVVRDNKTGVTYEAYPKYEPNGEKRFEGKVSAPLPGGNP
jgi:hypothetical protein